MNLKKFKNVFSDLPPAELMPVLFVGHGSPINAVEVNEFTKSWIEIGKKLPKPRAILCISAHWFVDGTYVHGAEWPKTIHDFYGFPSELYDMRYACPGAPDAAKEVQNIITKTKVGWDTDGGIDHVCWVVMKHLFPGADVPVFQLSLDATKPPAYHYELAKELASLRRQGVLVVGSGNIVHNLGLITFDEVSTPYDWALEFDELSKKYISEGDHKALIDYKKLGHISQLAIPTPDHYWPLLYILALQEKNEQATFFAEGLTYKSISMRSVLIN